MKKILILALVAGLFVITCPNREYHMTTIKNGLTKVAESKAGFLGSMLMSLAVDYVLEHEIETHNYILFSTTSIVREGQDRTLSFGILGNVYFDEASVAAAFDRAMENKSKTEKKSDDD